MTSTVKLSVQPAQTMGSIGPQTMGSTVKHSEAVQSVRPLFIRERDLNKDTTAMDLCRAITHTVQPTKLEGVQKIQNLWRIYLKDKQARLELTVKPLVVNGQQVQLLDQNPNVTFSGSGVAAQRKDKLTIKNLSLSVSNDEIVKFLEEKGTTLASPVRYGLIRGEEGHLTSYKSGDRFVFVDPFDPPLPKEQNIGIFKCVVLYHGKTLQCKSCGEFGHKVGEDICKAKPTVPILAFKGYTYPLSNHYPCTISKFGKTFKTIEHILFWRMALEMDKKDLADEIYQARHAGKAKRLSKAIAAEEVRWEWEEKNSDFFKTLLIAKAEQCSEFRQCLIENRDMVIAEATPNKLWASGLSPYLTERTAPNFWPGRNLLGDLLMNLASELTGSEQEILDVDMAQSPHTSTSAEHHSDTPLTVSESTSDTSASHPGTQHHLVDQPISQNSESLEISTAETTQPDNSSEEHATVNQSPQHHGAVSKGACTPLAKSGNHIPSCHQSRHRGPLSEHPRQRSSSLSHVQKRKSCLHDQDIRTAIVKRK